MESPGHTSTTSSGRRASLTGRSSFVGQFVRGPSHALQSIRDDVRNTNKSYALPPIRLPRPLFWAAWVTMFVMQLVVMLYILGSGVLHFRLAQPRAESVRVVYNLPDYVALKIIAVIMFLVVIMYLVNLKRMVSASIKAGRLAFWQAQSVDRNAAVDNGDTESAGHQSMLRHYLSQYRSSLWLSYRTVFGRRGLLGIENRYFNQVLTIREGVEIVSQSYQSYRMSHLVAIANVTALSSLLLAINCWSTPLVHLIIRRNTSAQRVMCLAIDVVLQFIWAIAIPVRLVAPYARAYDRNTRRFPPKYTADNAFMLNWEMHSQQVLVSSLGDFLSKLTPIVSIFAACRGIGTMLEERSAPSVSVVSVIPGKDEKHSDETTTRLFKPRQIISEQEKWLRWSHHNLTRAEKIAHVVYALWGLVVVANQLRVSRVIKSGTNASCLVELRPWFTKQYSCSLVEIDCYRAAKVDGLLTSEAAEAYVEALLSRLNPQVVSFVAFVHCPGLRMPPNLASFNSLRGLEIYNSTIADWDLENASLRQSSHPILRRVSLVRTPLDRIPAALLVNDLPRSLLLLSFVATGITTLPLIVNDSWRHVQYLVLEHSPLSSVPEVLPLMVLGTLSLTNSNLSSLPDFPRGKFEQFLVGSNPITQLPSSIGDLSTVAWLSFDRTSVATLPAWISEIHDTVGVQIYGEQTPYCRKTKPLINCATVNSLAGGMYPLREETEQRTAQLLARG